MSGRQGLDRGGRLEVMVDARCGGLEQDQARREIVHLLRKPGNAQLVHDGVDKRHLQPACSTTATV